MHIICGAMSDAMHGVYKDHSCDETTVQATTYGGVVSHMHRDKAL